MTFQVIDLVLQAIAIEATEETGLIEQDESELFFTRYTLYSLSSFSEIKVKS